MISRAKLRGKPLDRDCQTAHRTSGEYGPDDDRVFCYGLADMRNDELLDKCKICKANVWNATPMKESDNE